MWRVRRAGAYKPPCNAPNWVLNPGLNRRERNKGIGGWVARGRASGGRGEGNVRETGAKMGENPHSEPSSLSPPPRTFSLSLSLSLFLSLYLSIYLIYGGGVQLVDLTNSPIDLCLLRLYPCLSGWKDGKGVRLLRKWMHFAPRG